MGILSEVKCARCDRRYSGLRSRCPYCGARRSQRSKRSSTGSNNMWKVIIGLLLLLILIAAVIVLVIGSLAQGNTPKEPDKQENIGNMEGEGATNLEDPTEQEKETEGTPEISVPEDNPISEPEDKPAITSLVITCFGEEIAYEGYDTDYEISVPQNSKLNLGYRVTPEDVELKDSDVVWSSDNMDCVVVLQTGELSALGAGEAVLTLTIGELSKTVYVRVED